MQIHAIHIDHFLSFDTFAWEGLDPHLNVIVSPNGSGKTNLFHALRAVRDALSPERAQATARWADAGHQGTNTDTITIALDLQFTTAWEQGLLCTFLATVLCDQQVIQQTITTATSRNLDTNSLRRFAAWVQEQLHPKDIFWLFSGRLVVTYVGREGWQCQYEARPGKPLFQLDLTGGGTLFGHAEHNPQTSTQNWGTLFAAWRNSLTEREREQLDNGLTGASPEGEFPVPNLSRLPDWVSSQHGVALQIEDQMRIVDPTTLATRRALTLATQVSPGPQESFGMRFIFRHLLDQALVFTDNVRLLPQRTFIARDLLTQPLDLSNGKELARFLFRKKNGNPRDRKLYADIWKLFVEMTRREFDIVLGPANSGESQPRLTASFQQGGSQPEQQQDISLKLVTSGRWGDIPLEFSGAGIAEALFLSAVLAGSSGQVVLLDEPALNLHPTMQATLLDELQTLAHRPLGEGRQFLVNTHSPTLVPPDAIDRVSRFTLQDGHTICQSLNVGDIDPGVLDDLRKLLRGNLAARAFLFSSAVLLLEGETELGALPVWFPDLVRQDIALYAVGGKGEFASPLKLIQHFNIPWAIVGDGEVLWDRHQRGRSHGSQDHIRAILAVCNLCLLPIPGDPGSDAQVFAQVRQNLEAYGIFTLASGAIEGFERALQTEIKSELLDDADAQFGSNKVARGRFIAENSQCPEKVAEMIRKVTHHLHKQGADIRIPNEDGAT
jgi:hypothetical protein